MAYRTFVDPMGATWQVWEVRPTTVERRLGERRSAKHPYTGPERRSGQERRAVREQRVSLGAELAHGWLAFHSASEKRRYAPIPHNWATFSSAQLTELCAQAKPVSLGGPRNGDEDLQRSA